MVDSRNRENGRGVKKKGCGRRQEGRMDRRRTRRGKEEIGCAEREEDGSGVDGGKGYLNGLCIGP